MSYETQRIRKGTRKRNNVPKVLSNLLHADEKAVNIVSRGAGVQCLFVLFDLQLDKLSQFLNVDENCVLGARQMFHDPRKDVIHLQEGSPQDIAAMIEQVSENILYCRYTFNIIKR